MWADNETDQDLLGFSIHAQLLEKIITTQEMLPVTVGLFGDWGGGKSSILKMLQHNIEQCEDYAVIYFNSWIFEGYEDAKYAILNTLLRELRDHRDLKGIIGDEVKALLTRVNWMKIAKLGASVGISYLSANPLPLIMAGHSILSEQNTKQASDAEGNHKLPSLSFDEILKASPDSVENVRSFRADFQKLIEKTKLKSLVVLIDDLDRCSPERVIQNLEAIKLFLNVKRTAFVVATDRRIIENAIRLRYNELFTGDNGDTIGGTLINDYLEKLIQVPYTLPKLAPHEVRSYLCMLFLKKYLSETEFDIILQKYNQFLIKERFAAFQLGDELSFINDETARAAVNESMRLVEACSDAITDGLKGNPRQIKRFLNAFWMRKELANVANITSLRDHVLIKLMVLEYINSDRFEELYQWHRTSNNGTSQQLGELENSESLNAIPDKYSLWRTTRLWRWIKAEPSIATEDLRDYFWVARSSIKDTLSGVRLITQAMRTCSEELISKREAERRSGVELYSALTEDEQDGVLGILTKHALQDLKDDTALRSLLDLSSNSHVNAAESFERCVNRIGVENLSPGFGITLRAFKVVEGNRASETVGQIRGELEKTDTMIGRSLQQKKKSKK